MDNRREKIELLSRTNRGRAAAPSFLADLSEALGEPVGATALRPLQETDALLESFRSGYKAAVANIAVSYRKFFLPTERASVLRIADCLADQLPAETVFFLTKLSKECGAVSLPVSTLLRHTASIIRLDGDSLSALSNDQTQGIVIDHNQDDSRQAYEVVVWGDRWSLLGLACDPTSH
jgi:hypothetical protein